MKNSLPILLTGVMALLLSGCGTYNNGYSDTDGIYSNQSTTTATAETEEAENSKANYYKQYFESKGEDLGNLPEEDLIFTDIDAYTTTETVDENGNIIIVEPEGDESFGGWGSNASDITVNVYGGAGAYWGYWNHWNQPWGWGWGWNRWGWGWNQWAWGWGPGFFCPNYWGIGWGWGSPFWYGGWYGGWYGYGHYGNAYRPVASYNRGRRNLDYAAGRSAGSRYAIGSRRGYSSRSALSNRSSVSRRNANISSNSRRSTSVRRGSTISTNRRANARVNSNRSSNVQRRSSSTRPRINSNRRSTRSSGSFRSSRPSRSSGSFRSSGGSFRSSGSRGGGRRGRG